MLAKGGPPSTIPGTGTLPAAVIAGLQGDGAGVYAGTFDNTGDFGITVTCGSRTVTLVLPAGWSLGGAASNCFGSQGKRVSMHIPDLRFTNGTIGTSGHTPGSSNYSPDLFWYFHVDANGNGVYDERKNDTSFNVVWTDAVGTVTRTVAGVNCDWHVSANTAQLWKTPYTLVASATSGVTLDMVVKRTDSVCS
jgi:hypothetical protein